MSDLPTMDSDTMREIVGRYKHSKPTASITVVWKKLKEWADQPSKLHRKYHWYNATQLKTRIKEIDTRVKIPVTKQAVFDLLVECEIKQKQRNDAIASGEVSSIQSYVQSLFFRNYDSMNTFHESVSHSILLLFLLFLIL